jgi:hypothetical protein
VLIDLPVKDVAPWIGDGELQEVTDNSTRMTIGSWSWIGLLAFVTRFDAPFTVIGPEPLRAAAATLTNRFRAAHDQPGRARPSEVSS